MIKMVRSTQESRIQKIVKKKSKLKGASYQRMFALSDKYNRMVNNLKEREMIYYSQRLMPEKSKLLSLKFKIKKYSTLRDIYLEKGKLAKKREIKRNKLRYLKVRYSKETK
jgi:hypothetical protein